MSEVREIKQITAAINKVMDSVKGIDKTMSIGFGNNTYKGVSDQEVKKVIGKAMVENGLAIVPIGVSPNIKIDRYEEGGKIKQSVFTDVTTKYLLMHTSGESIEVMGYGHGIDSQDKGAGKATTYALKYLLLYMFMVPTGKIDDADAHHSDDSVIPQKAAFTQDTFDKMRKAIEGGKSASVKKSLPLYDISPAFMEELTKLLK